MSFIEAIILGIIQGLTEFLPVSSSGHLELGKVILGVEIEEDLGFTVMVHLATVLSTITVFHKDIIKLLNSFFKFKWNDDMQYIVKILIAAIPVLIVGLFLEEEVEGLFGGKLLLVGGALLLTAILLGSTSLIKSGNKKIPFRDALIIGVAQALAVIPGLSRSGSTIATGLLLKNEKEDVTRFSFLMVLIPIIGASFLKILSWIEGGATGTAPLMLVAGFVTAYISGYLACRWMISIVKKGKLIWFAIYCALVGLISIIVSI